MDGAQFFASMLGGGLAGGGLNVLFNRIFYWRSLRIKLYPILSHMLSTYALRMEDPGGRYLETVAGRIPLPNDDNFVRHRGSFLVQIVEFTELREARELRRRILSNLNWKDQADGTVIRADLLPEYQALRACLKTLNEKLELI
jgi:hypothetical protein